MVTNRRLAAALLAAALLFLLPAGARAQTDPEPPWPEISPYDWVDPDNPDVQLTLTANLIAVSGDVHTWKAKATDTATGAAVADLDVTIAYGPVDTVYTVAYQRYPNRWGFPPFSTKRNRDTFPTVYDDDGTIAYATVGELTWYAAFVGANPLTPALIQAGTRTRRQREHSPRISGEATMPLEPKPVGEGWTPNGCNKPCSNHWKACCDVHDACYCKGGDATDRKNCDEDFKACLIAAGMANWKAGLYHKAVRLFGKSHFNCTDPMGC